MNYIIIRKVPGGYRITFEIEGYRLNSWTYIGYGKKEAIRQARQRVGLVGKHLTKIEL